MYLFLSMTKVIRSTDLCQSVTDEDQLFLPAWCLSKNFMALNSYNKIDDNVSVTDIVNTDYRAADVFRNHGIDFCCGGKWSLRMMCEIKGLDIDNLKRELEESTRDLYLPNSLRFEDWGIDFLTDYIVNVHHQYLRKVLPETKGHLSEFVEGHKDKFEYLPHVLQTFNDLSDEMIPHLDEEETIIFTYIRQIAHAYQSRESYVSLLVRTLRKPVENVMQREHQSVNRFLSLLRQLTNNYTTPEKACTSHKVVFSKLREIDNDLVQHLHLENDILFPRAIAIEKELLELNNG